MSKGQISKLERADGEGARELTRAWAERFAKPLNIAAERILFWDKMGPPEEDDLRSEDVAASLPKSGAAPIARDSQIIRRCNRDLRSLELFAPIERRPQGWRALPAWASIRAISVRQLETV